ncbi:MAG: flippase [Ignavibacteriaceae bacterium]
MSEAVRIRRNSLFSFLSISSRLISNVVVFLIVGAHYGPKVFGQFTIAHTFAIIFILFADFGFDILLTTEVAKNRKVAPTIFQRYFSLKIVFSITALIAMWLLSLFLHFSPTSRILILIFSFYVILTTLTNFLHALYRGLERLEYETKVSLIVNVSLLFFVFFLLIIKVDIIYVAIAFVSTRFLGFIFAIIYSFRVLPDIKYNLNFKDWHKLMSQVLIFGLQLIFGSLFFQIDTIMLAFWKGDSTVGIYQATIKLIALPLVIPDILINTLLPVLSRLNTENELLWIKLGGLLNKTLTLIILPISIVLFTYPDFVINLIYPTGKYAATIPILRIFALILFIRFSVESYALMLTTSHKQKIRMFIVLFGTIFNFGLNLFVIPKYGANGAAVISLVTNMLVGFGYIITTLPLFYKWAMNFSYLFPIIIAAGLSSILWPIKEFEPIYMIPIIIVICYFLFIRLTFSNEERNLVFKKGINFQAFFPKIY